MTFHVSNDGDGDNGDDAEALGPATAEAVAAPRGDVSGHG
jgi:hypothetical protein